MRVAMLAHRAAPAGAEVEPIGVQGVEVFPDYSEKTFEVSVRASFVTVKLDLRAFCFDQAADYWAYCKTIDYRQDCQTVWCFA